jgi:hypothetical protein
MPCDDIRDRLDNLWEVEETPEIRRHLTQCTACKQYYRDLRLVHAGFRLWKRAEAPEPTLGFAERLVRQLGEISRAPSMAEFFERVGRRFVYAALVLTSLALLALAVPATGPVRGLSYADIYIPSQEASLANSDPMGETALQESPDWTPGEVAAPAGTDEVK